MKKDLRLFPFHSYIVYTNKDVCSNKEGNEDCYYCFYYRDICHVISYKGGECSHVSSFQR